MDDDDHEALVSGQADLRAEIRELRAEIERLRWAKAKSDEELADANAEIERLRADNAYVRCWRAIDKPAAGRGETNDEAWLRAKLQRREAEIEQLQDKYDRLGDVVQAKNAELERLQGMLRHEVDRLWEENAALRAKNAEQKAELQKLYDNWVRVVGELGKEG